ncbi:hypothetical protein IKF92_03535 [Candidatus Saccharibacteria bacterium]|nr:hypothetical protein [Candidatus Saccharibacteria bacterium]
MAKRHNKRKYLWFGLVLVVLLVTGGVVFAVTRDNGNKSETEETAQSDNDSNNSTDGKKEENVDLTSDSVEKKKVEQYDGDDPNTNNDLSGAVTYAAVSGDNLMIRVNIDQYLESGKCELILKKNDATIHSSIANIIDNASTATCEGFDVPVAKLGGGKIDIIINLSAGERSGSIRGEVNI